MSSRCPVLHWKTLLGLAASLFLAISGSTVLNMWYDRDIDAQMGRTCGRPLPSGEIGPREAFLIGLGLSMAGVGWAFLMDWLYGAIVFAGLFFDVVIYTLWLKRRTCWAILWGGLSGGMPVLAGRALGLGTVDWVGIILALGILFWIPTHILTFSIRYSGDYQRAGIPTFPSTYGVKNTRTVIALSSVLAALSMGLAAYGIGMAWGFLRLFGVLAMGLFLMAVASTLRPSDWMARGLFKYASVYMLGAMILVFITGI
jgi:protoheme IX farnesyltransferase